MIEKQGRVGRSYGAGLILGVKSFVAFPAAWWRAALPALLLAGCARPEAVSPPPNLLPKELITSILIETHLLEARVETSHLSPDSARALFLSQERELLARHGITAADSTFQRSYRYYATHDKDLDGI